MVTPVFKGGQDEVEHLYQYMACWAAADCPILTGGGGDAILNWLHSHVKDSSILLTVGVRDMDHRWDSTRVGGLFFGGGTTSAVFQNSGRYPSRSELLNTALLDPAKYNAKSRKTHARIPSGPIALLTLSLISWMLNFLKEALTSCCSSLQQPTVAIKATPQFTVTLLYSRTRRD